MKTGSADGPDLLPGAQTSCQGPQQEPSLEDGGCRLGLVFGEGGE